ncbi:MAG: hypothetical protein INQ03_10440 [Candidatus Heimdallarchaeota archaeon]|nr:hypothetical protein [Candidatus Heimdallarchaeota archaeon]
MPTLHDLPISVIRERLLVGSFSKELLQEIASPRRPREIDDDCIMMAIDQIDDENYWYRIAIAPYSTYNRVGFSKTVRKYAFRKITKPELIKNIIFKAQNHQIQNQAMNKLAVKDPSIYHQVIFSSGNNRLRLNALRVIADKSLLYRFAQQDNSLLTELKAWKRIVVPIDDYELLSMFPNTSPHEFIHLGWKRIRYEKVHMAEVITSWNEGFLKDACLLASNRLKLKY